MKCKQCGAEIIVGQRFCSNCCMPIEYDENTRKKFEEKQNKLEQKKKNNKTKKKIIAVVSSIIPVFVLCFIFVGVFFDKDKGFTTDKAVNMATTVSSVVNQTENEEVVEERIKIPISMGESCSTEGYDLTLLDVDIVDKDYDRAILFNFKSGEEFVFIKLGMYNKLYEDVIYSSLFQFEGICDGVEVLQSKSGAIAEPEVFPVLDGTNYRRSTKEGYICYSLPDGWKKLELDVNIDNVDGEPLLIIENPKNRPISEEELDSIIEKCGIDDFLYDADLSSVSDEDLYRVIRDFMHKNALSKTDYVPPQGLQVYIREQFKR